MDNERGFVLIEFVIALPLILMLLYGLSQSTLMIFSTAKSQAANYVLEVEAQDALTRITNDLRAASSVERYDSGVYTYGKKVSDCENIIIKYHTNSEYYSTLQGKTYKNIQDESKIFDIMDTRVYIVAKPKDNSHVPYLYAQRQSNKTTSPITGGNFFGDTEIMRLQYTKLDDRVIHITLEMRSDVTNQRIRLSTAVFMPACEKMNGFDK